MKNNSLKITSLLKSSRINIKGTHNSLLIQAGDIKRLKIGILGTNNIVDICSKNTLRDLNIIIEGNNLYVAIQENCQIGGATIVCCGKDSSIIIEKDCLFASNIELRNNDGHSIIEDGIVINPSQSIHIGHNVWVCQNAKILKGVSIGANSIIALNALVTKGIYPQNSILAGTPAKVIKQNISWDKKRTD